MKRLFLILLPFLFLSCGFDEHYIYLKNIDDSIRVYSTGPDNNKYYYYNVPVGTVMYFQWHFTGDENITDEVELSSTDNLKYKVISAQTIKVTTLAAGKGILEAKSDHYGSNAVYFEIYQE